MPGWLKLLGALLVAFLLFGWWAGLGAYSGDAGAMLGSGKAWAVLKYPFKILAGLGSKLTGGQ